MHELSVYDGPQALAIEVEEPAELNPACTACSLHKRRVHTPCMSAELTGAEDGPLLYVVGQGPGEQEDRQGRPNVGSSGSYLRDVLGRLWSGPIVLDNALRCAPGATKLNPAMARACRRYGAKVFRDANPARIVCLGGEAIAGVVGRSYPVFQVRRGYTYTSTGVPVLFVLHPAAALRNRFVRAWFEEDIAWALEANPPKAPLNAAVLLVRTHEEAVRAAEDLRSAPWVTLDFETFGAPFNREFRLLNLSLTPGGDAVSYMLERQALEDEGVFGPIRQLLEDPSVPKGGHNLKYDVICGRAKLGVRIRGIAFDTLLQGKLLDADRMDRLEYYQPSVGMGGGKDATKPYHEAGAKELRKLHEKPGTPPKLFADVEPRALAAAVARVADGDDTKRYTFAAIPAKERNQYGAKDTISTDRLKMAQDVQLATRPDLQRIWSSVTQDLNHAIACMEFNGIAASRSVVRKLQEDCARTVAEAKIEMFKWGEFNPNAHEQVGDLLFNKLGLPSQGKTATGKHQTTKEVLEKLDHPVCAAILAYKRAAHFKAQYADGMARYIQDDGRIHPSMKIGGTATGRPSCENPNLLNIPRAETEDGKLCRDVFVAMDDNWRLLEFDYSQIELRVAAMLSEDDTMIQFFKDGVDFHLATARMIAPLLGLDPALIDAEHPLRSRAKIVNFSTLYGDPPAGLAAKLNISTREAVRIQQAILGKFVKLDRWIKESLAFARKHGYCRTWWDGRDFRQRSLWRIADGEKGIRETAERGSWNTRVQGTAAEYTNASLGAIQKWLERDRLRSRLVLTVYDSILFEAHKDEVSDVVGKVQEIMTSWPSNGVPLKADVKIGQSWGSLEKKAA